MTEKIIFINNWIQTKQGHITLIIASIISAVVGTILFGTSVEMIMRQIFELASYSIVEFVIPISFTFVFLIFGTYLLYIALKVKDNKLRIWLLILNLVFPTILEIIDLSFRMVGVFSDLMVSLQML